MSKKPHKPNKGSKASVGGVSGICFKLSKGTRPPNEETDNSPKKGTRPPNEETDNSGARGGKSVRSEKKIRQVVSKDGIYRCSNDGQTIYLKRGELAPLCSCGKGKWVYND